MHESLGVAGLWCLLAACAAASAGPPRTLRDPRVLPGIDVLLEDSLQLVRNRRVGLLTDPAGVDAQGTSDLERLERAGVRVVALFGAEHGFSGTAAPGAPVATAVDSATGLPIYSLYGGTSSPLDSVLESLDLVLVDLPDAGARYFSHTSTTLDLLRAAGRAGRPLVVLDRPNPIGRMVQGNLLDTAYRSTVGALRVPMRHGLTAGELARLGQEELGIAADLRVVPARNWRGQALDQTGLPFIQPSPNLPTLESLFHYAGLCLFEATALSVGRGSEAPFEQIGAPWLDTTEVLRLARSARLPGVKFASNSFMPRNPGDGKFADTLLAGIRLRVTDRGRYDPVLTAVTLIAIIQRLHPDRIGWSPTRFDRLAGGPALREALESGREPAKVAAEWRPELEAWKAATIPWLLYPADFR